MYPLLSLNLHFPRSDPPTNIWKLISSSFTAWSGFSSKVAYKTLQYKLIILLCTYYTLVIMNQAIWSYHPFSWVTVSHLFLLPVIVYKFLLLLDHIRWLYCFSIHITQYPNSGFLSLLWCLDSRLWSNLLRCASNQ